MTVGWRCAQATLSARADADAAVSSPAAAPRRAAPASPAIGPIATAASHRPDAPPPALPAVASPSRSPSRADATELRQLAHRCAELGAIQLGLDQALEARTTALRSGQDALAEQLAQQGREGVAVAQAVLALQCQLGHLQQATTEAVSELWGVQELEQGSAGEARVAAAQAKPQAKPQAKSPLEAALHSERDAHAATASRVARVEAELAASVAQQYRLQRELLLMQSTQASVPPSPQCWPSTTTANKGGV